MTLKLSGPSKIEAGKERFTSHGAKYVCVIVQPRDMPTIHSRAIDDFLSPSAIVSRQSLGFAARDGG